MDYLDEIRIDSPELADCYDELPLWSAPFARLLLERVPLRRGATVLDVGAGTGFLSIELAQRCGEDSSIIAVDPWEPGLDRLRRKLAALGIDNVEVIATDAASLDLPEGSIDVAVSNLGINNFRNAAEVLATCHRLLAPEGRLLVTTNLTGHMRELYAVYRATLVEVGLADRMSALDEHEQHRGTVESVSSLLAEAGFELLEVATDSFRMRFADGSAFLRHYFVRLGFVPAWKAMLPPQAVVQTFRRLERKLNEVAAVAGELSMSVPMACLHAVKPDPAHRVRRFPAPAAEGSTPRT